MANTSDYHPPTLTVDMVVFCVEDAQLKVLLINRTAPPFQGEWALPGGYNAAGETTTQAVGASDENQGGDGHWSAIRVF